MTTRDGGVIQEPTGAAQAIARGNFSAPPPGPGSGRITRIRNQAAEALNSKPTKNKASIMQYTSIQSCRAATLSLPSP